jgi:hypothetical protein
MKRTPEDDIWEEMAHREPLIIETPTVLQRMERQRLRDHCKTCHKPRSDREIAFYKTVCSACYANGRF